MSRRNWLVEDNLVALYIALYEYKGLDYNLEKIKKIITHSGFSMRIKQFIAIHTKGKSKNGLNSGLKSPLYLYCVILLKLSKSFIRIAFQGNSPHGKDKSWSDDLKYENRKFSRKLIFSHKWLMAC